MLTYTVSVRTGQKKFAGTVDHIELTLEGAEGRSGPTRLDTAFFRRLANGKEVSINISVAESLGDVVLVTLEKQKLFNDDWYCSFISVKTPSGDVFEFPCYRWINNNKKVFLRDGKGRLPQRDERKEYRRKELESRQQLFRWREWSPGFPMSIDANSSSKLPLDVQFDTEKTVDFNLNFIEAIKNLGLNKFVSLFKSSWDNVEDFGEVFLTIKNSASEHLMQNWNEDFMFGYQFLNGPNPVMIRKIKSIPDRFAVTQEMVKDSLDRGLTLQEELKAGNIYILDYEILDGVKANATDPNTQQYLAAPFCLLYKNRQNEVVPIAIQLGRQREGSPVFLPGDPPHDWMLAKMWVKSCDFNVHQLVTHLLRTHLTSEVFTIAMYRQLAAVHPVYKLLMPHVRFTIAVNTAAREKLINESGIFNKANSGGGTAIGEVIQRAMKTLTFKSMCFPETLKARGVDSKEDLPNYFYRDDGLMVWDAVKSFVWDVVKIYYDSDEALQKDEEIQAFVRDVRVSGMKNCPNYGEFPEVLKTRGELVEYLTVVIFTASAQHAAVNFGQFDWFAWIPNTPSTMRRPPPTQKGQVDMKYIMESLPDRGRSSWHIGAVWALSQFQDNELFLGMYPDQYFTEQPVIDAITTFQHKLAEVADVIKSRNEKLKVPYWYLCPDRIPNSVAI